MHDRSCSRIFRGAIIGQPLTKVVHLRNFAGACTLPTSRPTTYLTTDESFGRANQDNVGIENIYSVQRRERVNHSVTNSSPRLRIVADFVRYLMADNQTTPQLHQIKWNTNHSDVFAEKHRPWCKRKVRMNRFKQTKLTRHIVGGRRHWTNRRPPQDKLL